MKVKKFKIRSLKDSLKNVADVLKKIQAGKKVKPQEGVYFEDMEAMRKILTPERLKLLHYIKTDKPHSIYQVAKGLKKDIKNVADDLNFLSQIGLVEMEETKGARGQKKPVLLYDQITFELTI
ncbi:ArsR family transcriptional regulator [bacterium]|nr:ArsR family transcriptional regulator [bacterium]